MHSNCYGNKIHILTLYCNAGLTYWPRSRNHPEERGPAFRHRAPWAPDVLIFLRASIANLGPCVASVPPGQRTRSPMPPPILTSYRSGCTFRPAVRSESEARRRVLLLLDVLKIAQHFKRLEGQSWNPPSWRARLERSWPERRPQTRAEVQRQIPPDHAGERRTANSPSSRQWMRKELRRR